MGCFQNKKCCVWCFPKLLWNLPQNIWSWFSSFLCCTWIIMNYIIKKDKKWGRTINIYWCYWLLKRESELEFSMQRLEMPVNKFEFTKISLKTNELMNLVIFWKLAWSILNDLLSLNESLFYWILLSKESLFMLQITTKSMLYIFRNYNKHCKF